MLEGLTAKRESLVSYNKILSIINYLKARGRQAFLLLHQMCVASTSKTNRLQKYKMSTTGWSNFSIFKKKPVHVRVPIKVLISPLESTFFWSIIHFCVWHASTQPTFFSTKWVLSGSILSGCLAPQSQHVPEIPSVSAPWSSFMPPILPYSVSPAPRAFVPLSR